MKLHDFKRKFQKLGVSFDRGGKHPSMSKIIDGVSVKWPYPVKNNEVLYFYVKEARRYFHLTPEDGISNEYFDSL